MLKDNLKGLWIPIEILTDDAISDKEKLIYSLLLFFSTQNGSCTITNNLISNLFAISKTQVSKLISSLKSKSYIEVEILRDNSNQIINRTITPIKLFNNTPLTKVNEPIKLADHYPIEEKFTVNNNIYLKNKYKKEISPANRMNTSQEYEDLNYDLFYAN